MPVDHMKNALYLQGTFSQANPTEQQKQAMLNAAQDIGASGFGTVILGQWHVYADNGNIYYNDSMLDSVTWALENIPAALKQGGNVEKVLLTFGPFRTDFQGIQENLALFKTTISKIQSMSAIDGLDWDLEQHYDQFGDLLVDLTQWANSLGMIVTAAPYQDNGFWTDVLKRTNTGGSAGFSWWNLQLYGGASYPNWVDYLNGLVPKPDEFLVPGYKVAQGASPSYVQNNLSELQQSFPSLDGGFIWKYEAIAENGYTAKEFATAIETGLSNTTGIIKY